MAGSVKKYTGTQGTAYRVRVEYPPDPTTGKRRQRQKSCRTKREADTLLAEWLTEIERGTAVDGSRMTFGEYLRHWQESVSRPNVRPTTSAGYDYSIQTHIIPALGFIPLQKLTTDAIQAFYGSLLADGRKDGKGGLSNRTVRICHMLIRQALKQAVAWKYVSFNATDGTKPPRVVYPQVRTWDVDEVQRFLAAAGEDDYSPLWLVALTTGMRRGEVLGLRWQDIDFDRGVLHIRQCVAELRGKGHIQEPKTKSGRRSVTLSESCIAALRQHRARQNEYRMALGSEWSDNDLVFASPDGTVLQPRNVLKRYYMLTKKAGVPRIRFHDLRHTHATILLTNEENVKVVSERLGHASVSITLDTYHHVLPSMQRQAAKRIDDAFFGTGRNSKSEPIPLAKPRRRRQA